MPVSPGASGMQPRDPDRPWRKDPIKGQNDKLHRNKFNLKTYKVLLKDTDIESDTLLSWVGGFK